MTTAIEHDSDPIAAEYEDFLGELRGLLAKRRIKQSHLAPTIGLRQQHLSNRLNGITPFTALELMRLAAALDMPLAELSSLADARPSISTGDRTTGWFPRHRVVAIGRRVRRRMRRRRPMGHPHNHPGLSPIPDPRQHARHLHSVPELVAS